MENLEDNTSESLNFDLEEGELVKEDKNSFKNKLLLFLSIPAIILFIYAISIIIM